MRLQRIAALSAALAFSSCGGKFDHVQMKQLYQAGDQTVRFSYSIQEIHGASSVDVLWVIDNSGSMEEEQATVIRSTASFMSAFTQGGIDWKMGLLSSSVDEMPYIGLAPGTELDTATPDSAGRFASAVGRLGTDGDADELFFEPVVRNLRNFPNFKRQNTPLAIIFVTDALEQSNLSAQEFMDELNVITGGVKTYFYGAIGARDLGCTDAEYDSTYAGGKFDELTKLATRGKVFPICTPDFSANLTNMTQEIVQLVQKSLIPLRRRPDPKTIEVTYGGQKLPAGLPEEGGIWMYDHALNAVVFNSMTFARTGVDDVSVSYQPAGVPVPIPLN